MAKQVFLSYSTDDTAAATSVRHHLEDQGIRCWMAPRDITPGQDYAEQIIAAIEAATVLVLILSESSNQSHYVRNEVERAVAKRKVIVPFRMHNVTPSRSLEFFISNCQWIDAWEPPLSTSMDTLVQAIQTHLGGETPPHSLAPSTGEGVALSATKASPTHNLPHAVTPFVGREAELGALHELLTKQHVRLVTLLGPGGMGKTRLALQTAARLLDHFVDGVYFVALAPIHDPNLVLSAIAHTLGIREMGGHSLRESLQDVLRERQMLLVLDNFEQVAAAAPLVSELLAGCRQLQILVTSRAALHLYGEHEFPLPPLALPDAQRLTAIAGEGVVSLTKFAAVTLFVQRAAAVKPGFALTPANAATVAEICIGLEGLPLAIELAAAKLKVLPLPALLARLKQRLTLLTGGPQDLPRRQRTLRDTIAWSYDLLTAEDQKLFRRLCVFAGGFTLEAAESVCNANGDMESDVFDGIISLLDQSLLRPEKGPDGEPRFGMLETIREYASEQLAERGEEETLQRQHAAYFVALTQTLFPEAHQDDYVSRLERLECEHDNVRVALQWSIAHREAEMGVRFAHALWSFWYVRGFLSEGRRWLESILEVSQELAPARREPAIVGAAELARVQGDYPSAQLRHAECLAINQELGNKQGIARSLHDLANVALAQGNLRQARELSEESVRLRRELGEKAGISHALGTFGEVLRFLSDYPQAREVHEECLAIERELGNQEGIYNSLHCLGSIARHQQEYTQAVLWLKEGLRLVADVGDRQVTAYLLEELAGVALGQGVVSMAARIWGAAAHVRESIGCPLLPVERDAYELDTGAARAQLDDAAWEGAWAEGRAMTLEQAVAYALLIENR